MQKKVVDDYVRLFERAKVRNKNYDDLEKLVKKRIRKLELDKLKFEQVLSDIKKNKHSNKLEQQQFDEMKRLINQFDELSAQLTREELLLMKKYEGNENDQGRENDNEQRPYKQEKGRETTHVKQEKDNEEQPYIKQEKDNEESPYIKQENLDNSTQPFPRAPPIICKSPDKATQDNVPQNSNSNLHDDSKSAKPSKHYHLSTSSPTKNRTYFDGDQTLIESTFDDDNFDNNLARYYPKLILKKPGDGGFQSHNFSLPNLQLKITRHDYINLLMVQNLYLQLGVPYELWGIYISQYLHRDLLFDYLQLEMPATWYQVIYLILGNQDFFMDNCYKIENWCKKRPVQHQKIQQYLYEFKSAVEQSYTPNSFDIEKSILMSLLQPKLLSPDLKFKLQQENNRGDFYRHLFKQFPDSMTF